MDARTGEDHQLEMCWSKRCKGTVFLYDRASALILVLYITIGITLEGKEASVPVLENNLFSDVAAASCNLWQPLVGCNIISYLMQTWVLLQYHLL
jgi:putative lipase involved disintegration of autophagic bodies